MGRRQWWGEEKALVGWGGGSGGVGRGRVSRMGRRQG